jgi:hypothetical protein
MNGLNWVTLAKFMAVLAAAMIIGNWFLIEVKKAKFNKQPWYKPYISVPGLIILLAVLGLPLFFLLFEK